jgi:DNA-binding winged helix-turn-helix (wHTH) protein/pimeloyl-ACP methyl ester carboxylesterase
MWGTCGSPVRPTGAGSHLTMAKYLFGSYLLDVDERRLLRGNEEIRLRGKLFDTLRVLVENAGKLVRKDAFMESVWPDSVVEDNNLDYCISQLRKLLHPEKYIETVPRHGYRFVAPISSAASQIVAAGGQSITPLPRQDVRFSVTEDGVRLAWASIGDGPPLVKASNWLTHLDFEWGSPIWQHWWTELSKHHRLIRYDERGNGMSQRDVPDVSFDTWVRDLETVVDAAGLDRFSLLGISRGGSIAIAYAVKHPERVKQTGPLWRISCRDLSLRQPGRTRSPACTDQPDTAWLGASQSRILQNVHQPLHAQRDACPRELVRRSAADVNLGRKCRATYGGRFEHRRTQLLATGASPDAGCALRSRPGGLVRARPPVGRRNPRRAVRFVTQCQPPTSR